MADITYTIILNNSGVKAFIMPQGYWPDVTIHCWGAGGGAGRGSGAVGGGGGYASTVANIYEGDEVTLQIGQPGTNGSYPKGGRGGLDTSYRLFRGGNSADAYDEDADTGAGGGGGGASWVAVNDTYVCVGAGGGGAGGYGDDGSGGDAGLPGGVTTNGINTNTRGGDAPLGWSTGGGGGAGYPYGGKAGKSYGDDSGNPPAGSGGQNYGNVTVAGSGIRPGGTNISYYPGKRTGEAGYPGYIAIVLRKKLNAYIKNPDSSGDWVNLETAYLKIGEARPSVVSDTRTFNSVGSSTYKIPKEVTSINISYPTASGTVTQIIPVRAGSIIPVTVGDSGQDSSFGDFTIPAYTKQVFKYVGNVDHLLTADVQIATANGAALKTSGYNASQQVSAAAAGITYNVTYEGWHGDLYSDLTFNTVVISELASNFQIVAGGGGRNGAPTITAQPTVGNGYIMSIQFYDPGGGEGDYTGTFTLQQQGYFTISYNLPIVISPWKQIQQIFTKVNSEWKPILTNKTVSLYGYPIKRKKANIVISADTNDYSLYDHLPIDYFEGLMDVTVWVLPGVVITGNTTGTAFTINGFTDGDNVTLINYGTIQGQGGSGGSGGRPYYNNYWYGYGWNYYWYQQNPANSGSPGGTALLTTFPLILENQGTIAGGGGGGGGGGGSDNHGYWYWGWNNNYAVTGGTGGGGAGYGPGANSGTLTTGGAGATNGGSGGNQGAAGSDGGSGTAYWYWGYWGYWNGYQYFRGGAGGAAGYAIQGQPLVTFTVTGNVIGPVAG